MRNICLKISPLVSIIVLLLFMGGAVSAEEDEGKIKVRDPHRLHLDVFKYVSYVELSTKEISDWPGFVASLQKKIDPLPIRPEMKMFIKGLRPNFLSRDEKIIIAGEINKLIRSKDLYTQVKDAVAFSKDTELLMLDYKKTKEEDDLKWVNRSIMSDIFPEIPKKDPDAAKKLSKIVRINCITCHESWAKEEIKTELLEAMLFPPAEVPGKAKVKVDDAFLRNYNNLKKFIVRPELHGNPTIIEGVHSEDPYTFKPLLKRLVCVECHGPERKVSKITCPDGKTTKEIQLFYGEGSQDHDHKLHDFAKCPE